MPEYSSAYASAYEFGVERWLAGRVGRGSSRAVELRDQVLYALPCRRQLQQHMLHAPLVALTIVPRPSHLYIVILRARDVIPQLPGSTI